MDSVSVEIGSAVVLVLTSLATYLKAHGDVKAIKDDREATKAARDRESQELREKVVELQFKYGALKDSQNLQDERMNDATKAIGVLNTTLAQVLTKLDNIGETLKELKEKYK